MNINIKIWLILKNIRYGIKYVYTYILVWKCKLTKTKYNLFIKYSKNDDYNKKLYNKFVRLWVFLEND